MTFSKVTLNSNAERGGGLRRVWPSSIYILQDFCTHRQKYKLKDTREGNVEIKKKK